MKLKGEIQGVPSLMLVDSGATHNFISKKLVHAMGWKVEDTIPLPVKMGDGFQAKTQGECRDIIIEDGRVKLTVTALLFDLDDIDVVFGMAWLTKLGEMCVG